MLLLLGLATACSGSSPPATDLPTQVLIPPTITPTPVPLTATPTPPDLPSPADLLATTSAPQPLTPLIGPDAAPPELVAAVIDNLAVYLGLDPQLILPGIAEDAVWTPYEMSCRQTMRSYFEWPIPGYRLVLLVGSVTYEYRADTAGSFWRCRRPARLEGELLVAADPVAAEMLALAQQRVAQELDLPQRRVQLVEIFPVIWPDTGLGCPLPGRSYTALLIDGYRIVVTAGETEYAFHTDSVSLIFCAAGSERLP